MTLEQIACWLIDAYIWFAAIMWNLYTTCFMIPYLNYVDVKPSILYVYYMSAHYTLHTNQTTPHTLCSAKYTHVNVTDVVRYFYKFTRVKSCFKLQQWLEKCNRPCDSVYMIFQHESTVYFANIKLNDYHDLEIGELAKTAERIKLH